MKLLNAFRRSMAQLQSNAVVNHQLSHCHGGIPSVDDSVCLPAPLGLNPRDAELSSGKGVCFGSSFRRRDESAAGGVTGMQSIGSGWVEHSPSAGVTTE